MQVVYHVYFVVEVSIELVKDNITRMADARAGSPTNISVPLDNPSSGKDKELFDRSERDE